MTQAHHKEFYNTKISIHIPLARYDLSGDYLDMLKPISIHIPLARYDITDASVWLQVRISIHIPLARYD